MMALDSSTLSQLPLYKNGFQSAEQTPFILKSKIALSITNKVINNARGHFFYKMKISRSREW